MKTLNNTYWSYSNCSFSNEAGPLCGKVNDQMLW